jgi:hypothetical protein
MFLCFKDGVFFGVRCEDHGVAWRDWFNNKPGDVAAGLHDPPNGDVDVYCIDCVGEITGERVIIDRESAVWEWDNIQSDLAFDDWICDPDVRARYTWQYEDDAWTTGATFTLEECALIKSMLFDLSLGFHVAGRALPYPVDVFESVVKKVVDVNRSKGGIKNV